MCFVPAETGMPRGERAGPSCLWHCFTAIAVLHAGGAPSVPGTALLLSVSVTYLREGHIPRQAHRSGSQLSVFLDASEGLY